MKRKFSGQCHSGVTEFSDKDKNMKCKKIVMMGNPNVGKSVIFNQLTGHYVTVSNYPGTTVEVSRGKMVYKNVEYEIIDTPGAYSLLPITEEEKVARSILLEENPYVVLHIIDAKNIDKMLPFTFQLIESHVPVILVINLIDEAKKAGMKIDAKKLEEMLDIPVVETIATEGKNIDLLKSRVASYRYREPQIIKYSSDIENAINSISQCLESNYKISKRTISILLLVGDEEIKQVVAKNEKINYQKIEKLIKETQKKYSYPLIYHIAVERQKYTDKICRYVISYQTKEKISFNEKLSRFTMKPIVGIPLFIIILYLFYLFVGVFGAQTVVDFIEGNIFGEYINPFMNKIFEAIIPIKVIQDLFVHEYGIITLGIRYAIAIILPIVGTFFIGFSIIEDTGYLPRLAMLIDKLFKKIGLNGRAVIPMVLGFGCDTMATMVTRTLETKRERIIATLLLALAIPCSAQLGVILGLLAGNFAALLIWLGVLIFIFVLIGYLASKIIPGEKPIFYMEVPPLRFPKISNILIKTYSRIVWYLKEILPLFVWASVFIWIGRITGLFDLIINILKYPMRWIGLPDDAAVAFLFGFFRRDYGAAGLYDLKTTGVLNGIPLVVSVVTLTLFLPCVAQFSINIKERGWKTAFAIAAFIFPFAFFVGWILNLLLTTLGVNL